MDLELFHLGNAKEQKQAHDLRAARGSAPAGWGWWDPIEAGSGVGAQAGCCRARYLPGFFQAHASAVSGIA